MRNRFFFIKLIRMVVFGLTAMTVDAAALQISEDDVIRVIKQEFFDRGAADDGEVEIELFGGETEFDIENAKQAKVIINRLKTDEKLGRFTCEAEIFADRRSYAVSSLQGKYYLTTAVWVPDCNIAKGEIIQNEMLKEQYIRKSRLKSFMITDKDKLVGQEAKKPLKKDKIISDKDVGPKILVKRNDVVVAVYRTDKMQITTKAVAQQDGAYGDRIELQNQKTRKVLTGVVQDAATVVIEQ